MIETHKRPTQAQRILEFMKEHGSITTLDAIKNLGVLNLKGRIFELRKEYDIATRWETVRNRYGEKERIARYFLGGEK